MQRFSNQRPLKALYNAAQHSPIHTHVHTHTHTPTAGSTVQGGSQRVGSSQGEVPCSVTPLTLEELWDQTSNLPVPSQEAVTGIHDSLLI